MILSMPIPHDIIDYIVQNFALDIATLKACSLASRAFVTPTRKVLFAVVSLIPARCAKLSALLLANRHLSDCIREIYIVVPQSTRQPFQPDSVRRHTKALEIILNSLSPSHLRLLSMMFGDKTHRYSWGKLSAALRTAIERVLQFPSLETLNFIGVEKLPYGLFGHLSQTKSVILLSVGIDTTGFETKDNPARHQASLGATTYQHRRCSLEKLEVSYHFEDEPLRLAALRCTLDLSHLHSVTVLIEKTNPDDAWWILQDSLQSLETFTMYCYFYTYSVPEQEHFNLAAFAKLRIMRIVTDTTEEGDAPLRWLSHVLIRLASSTNDKAVPLEELTLHIDLMEEPDSDIWTTSLMWADIDKVLTSPPFAKLCKVSVYICNPPSASSLLRCGFHSWHVEDIIKDLAPSLHAKKILEARPTCLNLEDILKGAEETFVQDDPDDSEEEDQWDDYYDSEDDDDDDDSGDDSDDDEYVP